MSRPATYDDAQLLLRLYESRREEKLRQARDWFSRSFKARTFAEAAEQCPEGSEANAYLRMVTSYWEMVASLLTSGILNKELFYQTGHEMLGCWVRIRDIVPEIRQAFDNPSYLKNLEDASTEYASYMEKTTPGLFEKFAAMTRG